MTDDLSRSQEEAVRRLLAEARETGPMPADVAARLDAVIADLARTTTSGTATDPDTATGPDEAAVVPLRRRRLPQLVLAAAAVTAIGLGTVQVLDRAGEGQGDAAVSDAGEAAPDAGGAAESEAGDASPDEQELRGNARSGQAGPAPADEGPVVADGQVPLSSALRNRGYVSAPVTITGLDAALREHGIAPLGRLEALEPPVRTTAKQHLDAFSDAKALRDARPCGPVYDVVDGAAYLSTTRPDMLVVAHPPVNGIRLVEVYDCAGGDPRHTAGVVTLATEE